MNSRFQKITAAPTAFATGLLFLISTFPNSAIAQAPAPQFSQTAFTVKLTGPISTKTNKEGDEITAQVVSPPQYANWTMEGKVTKCMSSGSMTKKSELVFGFETLNNNKTQASYPISTQIVSFTNSKGVQNADEEGQIVEKKNSAAKAAGIGAAAGAGIGAMIHGAKGALGGAAAGAGAGLLYANFGVKGPTISFDKDSQFGLAVNTRQASK